MKGVDGERVTILRREEHVLLLLDGCTGKKCSLTRTSQFGWFLEFFMRGDLATTQTHAQDMSRQAMISIASHGEGDRSGEREDMFFFSIA